MTAPLTLPLMLPSLVAPTAMRPVNEWVHSVTHPFQPGTNSRIERAFAGGTELVTDVLAIFAGGAGAIRAAGAAEAASTTFHTVQGPEDAARLRGPGTPWPTAPSRAHLGPGVYSFGNRAEAEAYLARLSSRGVPDLEIVSFRVSNRKLASFRQLDIDALGDPAADEWLERYSLLRENGVPNHGLQYIRRGTNFGVEHFFHRSVFRHLRF